MDILAILTTIGLDAAMRDSFSHAFMMPAVYHSVTNRVTVTIQNDRLLPASVYGCTARLFGAYLHKDVDLVIKAQDAVIQTGELMNYLRLFSEMIDDQRLRNVIPQLTDAAVLIECPDSELLKKTAAFLHDVGITPPDRPAQPVGDDVLSMTAPAAVMTMAAGPAKTASISSSEGRFGTFRHNYQNKDIAKDRYLMVPMRALRKEQSLVRCQGKIFQIIYTTTRSKKEFQKIYLSDTTDAIMAKRFENRYLSSEEMHKLQEGQFVTVYGKVAYDEYERDFVIEPDDIEIMDPEPFVRHDEHPGIRRLEMHAHTNKSEMDGVAECRDIVKRAFDWGWDGVAIVDTAVVQAYPDAQGALLDIDKKHPGNTFKVVYGIEMAMADERLDIVYNPNDMPMKDLEYAIIDLETTGLSAQYDHIIEFGGAIVSHGQITAHKQMFIKPPVPLPAFTQQKCGITEDMLAQAPDFRTACRDMLDFIGDRVIVAHNAAFDFNFLNEQLRQVGIGPLRNACIDTLNLAKEIIPSRKYYRLGLIANNYGVEYDDESAHRGDYDADVLAQIFVKMVGDIPGYPQLTLRQLQEEQDPQIYKKARPTHVTILARNMAGIKDIYELVSLSHTKYLTYFAKENAKKADSDIVAEPRITRREVAERRQRGNILLGAGNLYSELFELAANRSQAQLEQAMGFYDFIEVQPVTNYRPLQEQGSDFTDERIRTIIKAMVDTGMKLGKKVIADNDSYYIDPSQKIARDIYIMAKRIGASRHPLYPLNHDKRVRFTGPDQHLMTTDEMLDQFSFLGGALAESIVVKQPHELLDAIERIYPIVQQLLTPEIPGSDKKLTEAIYVNAHAIYGDQLPDIVDKRITKELDAVIKNGRTVQYYIAYLLVKKASEDGFIVGSRGSVGSSFIATMAKITEVNPLVPHYICPHCHHSEFITDGSVADGFDLPPKACPRCGAEMYGDGHDIPFETFMGFGGDKVPDIDLNFPREYQEKAQMMIKEIFGDEYAYRAGTIGTVAAKTAYGYIKGYCEEKEIPNFSNAYMNYLSLLCENVKRTTGQHPAGIVVIPRDKEIHDFTPIQYPANNPFSHWQTTHFAISDLHDNILKLDILGHVDPSAVKMLQTYTGVDPRSIPMHDDRTLSLFNSTAALGVIDPDGHYHETNGAAGLPEFGTHNIRRILEMTKPSTFAELVTLSGLTHGTNVWTNNAKDLIDQHICTLKEVIGCRDDIMRYLIQKGLPARQAFDIMEFVRKGRGLKPEWITAMKEHGVPDWYIDSCLKIQYMFPKAHAVAYVTMAVRIAWYKVYYPAQYYAVFFSLRCDAYELATMLAGEAAIHQRLYDIQKRMNDGTAKVTSKEEALEPVLEVAQEMYLRGYHFNNLSITKSLGTDFAVDPDDDHGILPAFTAIDGLGANVGNAIVAARQDHPFISQDDFQKRGHVNDTQMGVMKDLGCFEGLSAEDQLTFNI